MSRQAPGQDDRQKAPRGPEVLWKDPNLVEEDQGESNEGQHECDGYPEALPRDKHQAEEGHAQAQRRDR